MTDDERVAYALDRARLIDGCDWVTLPMNASSDVLTAHVPCGWTTSCPWGDMDGIHAAHSCA